MFESVFSPIWLTLSLKVMVMDARDREYYLKTNFRNYTKNLEDDATSFDVVFSEVRFYLLSKSTARQCN
jgi:hypothetical protein